MGLERSAMKSYQMTIPHEAPNLNDLNRMQRAAARTKRGDGGYGAVKRVWERYVAIYAANAGIPQGEFDQGAHVKLVILEKNKRRDPDNLCSGATKMILDGLVKCGVLASDGWHGVLSLSYEWAVGGPGVVVVLSSRKVD
jgi:hypothetical protein